MALSLFAPEENKRATNHGMVKGNGKVMHLWVKQCKGLSGAIPVFPGNGEEIRQSAGLVLLENVPLRS